MVPSHRIPRRSTGERHARVELAGPTREVTWLVGAAARTGTVVRRGAVRVAVPGQARQGRGPDDTRTAVDPDLGTHFTRIVSECLRLSQSPSSSH
jgi:hypothetical protein